MAETQKISALADKLSNELFGTFGWSRVGPMNENWACTDATHGVETHPSDVVFSYSDIYKDRDVLVNTDLKSYAKGSIKTGAVIEALQSLALATECCRKSEDWQKRYALGVAPWRPVGLLFIYNHDGEYDTDFATLRSRIGPTDLKIPPGVRLFLLGPADIAYLATIRTDLRLLTADGKLPKPPHAGSFYPHLVTAKASHNRSPVFTLETLTAPWQVLRYTRGSSGGDLVEGCVVYMRSRGESADEFHYVFDYLFRYQLIDEATEVQLRMPDPCGTATATFVAAKNTYSASLPGATHVRELLGRVTLEHPTNIVKRYPAEAIGMD